jgi:tRNA-dihydrouridine synthase B
MNIGSFSPKNPFFLAPMAGITDLPFRKLCVEMGAGLVYTEMLSVQALYHGDEETLKMADTDPVERPCAVQIFGHEPDIIAAAVKKFSVRDDIALIDLNMGCPAPKIVKNGDGCLLMKSPELVKQIIHDAVNASSKPITVKFRKGWDDETLNYMEIGKIAEQEGASAVTLHGRTRSQMYSGVADWDAVKELKEALRIPVIGNGDIHSLPEARTRMLETSCDAVMIGRAAQGNPWVFRDIADTCKIAEIDERACKNIVSDSGAASRINRFGVGHTLEELLLTILRHYDLMVRIKGPRRAMLEMRKHIAWYLHGLPDATTMRMEIYNLENIDDVKNKLAEYLHSSTRTVESW